MPSNARLTDAREASAVNGRVQLFAINGAIIFSDDNLERVCTEVLTSQSYQFFTI